MEGTRMEFRKECAMRWMLMGSLGVCAAIVACVAVVVWGSEQAGTQPAAGAATGAGETEMAVTFTGGYETDGRDRGRPVVLVAAGLGVPADTFREAFKGVRPAGAGRGPTEEEARANKAALMKVLEPLGVTNDRLDEVSNYYRYNRSAGEMWKHVLAEAMARVKDGKVVGFVVTKAGAGYSSAPEVSVEGMAGVKGKVVLWFGEELKKNGSVKEIQLGE
jgi:hypothetical protein